MKIGFLVALTACAASPVAAQDWTPLPISADPAAVIDSNPLQGYLTWHDSTVVPLARPSSEHYFRVSWAELEPREGVYDFAAIDRVIARIGPHDRIAFGVMAVDTCCSSRKGRDVPDYLIDRVAKGFWIAADPGNYGHVDKVYVPDWNDPLYLARWTALWAAIGKHYDGDRRIAWVDVRGYGNWGEGHVAGAGAYHWSQFPYDDPAVNLHGARPGSEASRFAIADAVVTALPHTQLLAMTDDKPVLLHLLRAPTAIPIGMRRDSWGANWFEKGFLPDDMAAEDKALVRERWKTAPFIVENYGWKLVFEAGYDGIVKQIEDWHISALGNGNFSVDHWSQLTPEQQAALTRAGNRSGYRYVPAGIRYRTTAACPVEVAVTWRNDGVAPVYEAWTVSLSAGSFHGDAPLPRLLPGETGVSTVCLKAKGHLTLHVTAGDGSGRTLLLPLKGGDGEGGYDLGDLR